MFKGRLLPAMFIACALGATDPHAELSSGLQHEPVLISKKDDLGSHCISIMRADEPSRKQAQLLLATEILRVFRYQGDAKGGGFPWLWESPRFHSTRAFRTMCPQSERHLNQTA